MNNYFYKQPKYFSTFRCIADRCPENCCSKWEINWSKAEVEKLKNSNCSAAIREKAECKFRSKNNDVYDIILNMDGTCPFLNDEKLCMIQKELGEDMLSYICRIYPRLHRTVNNIITRTCSTSCYAVMDILCNNENSVDLVMSEVKESNVNSGVYDKITLMNKPELKYLNDIFDFFHEILNDGSRDIETSVVLGALAAKKINEFATTGKADMIPDVIKKLRPQINNKVQIDSINNMQPNYVFSLGVVNEIINKLYKREVLQTLYTEGKPDIDKYNIGMQKFNEAFKDRPYALKNVIVNYFMEFFSFYYKKDYSIYENYLYFAYTAAAVKLSCAVVGYACGPEDDIVQNFTHYQSLYARSLDCFKEAAGIVINYLNDNKWNTPAYIALMIK